MIDLAVHCFIRLPINSKSLEMSNMAKSNAARFAAMKAAEINAKLMAKGIPIKQEVLPIKQKGGVREQAMKVVHNAEIEINGLNNRGLIMRGNIQDQIGQWSGTTITTRGRYISQEMKVDLITKMERPLFINITAINKDWDSTIKKAIHYVLAVLGLKKVPTGSRGFPVDQYPDPTILKLCERDLEESTVPFVERVPCEMGDQPLPWNIKQEIEGPNGAFIEHIVQSTNAKIVLKGTLSGSLEIETGKELKESLFIQINHSSLEGLVEAKSLVDSLLSTVRDNNPYILKHFLIYRKRNIRHVHQKIRDKRKNAPFQKTFGVPTAQTSTNKPDRDEVVYPMQASRGFPQSSAKQQQMSRNQPRDSVNMMSSGNMKPSHNQGPQSSRPTSDNGSHPRTGMGDNQRSVMNHVLTLNTNNNERDKDTFRKPERVQSKRRFQENFDSVKKRKDKKEEQQMMPPPPPPGPAALTAPISAGNVSDWILETSIAKEPVGRRRKDRGRGKYNKTVVCAYSDSDEED